MSEERLWEAKEILADPKTDQDGYEQYFREIDPEILNWLISEVERLRTKLEVARECLQFYANKKHWKHYVMDGTLRVFIADTNGLFRAFQALKEIDK
jgi:hypothetical protein